MTGWFGEFERLWKKVSVAQPNKNLSQDIQSWAKIYWRLTEYKTGMTPPDDTFSGMETCANNMWYISIYKLGVDIKRLWKHNNRKLKSVQPIGRSKIKCGVVGGNHYCINIHSMIMIIKTLLMLNIKQNTNYSGCESICLQYHYMHLIYNSQYNSYLKNQ